MKTPMMLLTVLSLFSQGCAQIAYESLYNREAEQNRQDGLVVNPNEQQPPPSYDDYIKQREAHLKKQADKSDPPQS